MFTTEEAIAAHLGLADAQAAPGGPTVPAQTAMARVRRALPTADARRIDALLGAMRRPASGGGDAEDGGAAPDPAVMLTLAEAVNRRRVLDLRYRGRDGTPSRRTVHPHGLVAHADRWYLVAFDADRREDRNFRVDRIRTARATADFFTPPERPSAPADHLPGLFADADYRWRVVLCFGPRVRCPRAPRPSQVRAGDQLEVVARRVEQVHPAAASRSR